VTASGHPDRAALFYEDPERVRWHDQAIWAVRQNRDRGAAAVPEWESLRQTAAEIKAHTLSRLPDYLEEFEDRAARLGVVVHWASDANDHNTIVHGLLRDHGVTRAVKSKSMLSEECGLNAFLEARGIEVIDTDLGERIVQLRNEPPSHIVMPAIHLRREEIGELFHREFGSEEGLSDPDALVEVARDQLRRQFLEAEAGLTGVNFAIAETGGLVVVTNEGNADLGTALPRLHIASMGLEKVIPRLGDLGVFLRLLARSATGQALSVYTSHFHGPAPGGELHVVLVDNGRSGLLAREPMRQALSCIRCGACLNTCPVYRRSGGHSYGTPVAGPIGAVLSPARDIEAHATLPKACTLCGSCADVCPVKIDLPRALTVLRADAVRAERGGTRTRWASWLGSQLLRRPGWTRLAARLGRRLLHGVPSAWLERDPRMRGRVLPEVAEKSFRELWRERRDEASQ
jgi:L-lactate dehydrogenase complex protein LldF